MLDREIEAKEVETLTGTMSGSGTTRTITLSASQDNPVVPGSLKVTSGTVTPNDDGDGTLSGTGITDSSSTVNYYTGAVSIVFTTAPSAQPTVEYDRFEDLDSRDVGDIGDTPATLRIRNHDAKTGLSVQVSEDRDNWTNLFTRSAEAWEVPDCGRTSVRFVRVFASSKCRIFGSHLNLQ